MEMTEEQRLRLKLVSGLLDYPYYPEFWERIRDRMSVAEELDDRLQNVFHVLEDYRVIDLEQLYVDSFDFDAHQSLYLTVHEMGDSRDRGNALIELSELYRQAGYEVPDNLLADYLPLLLEFVALHPDFCPPALHERIARVAGKIAGHLDSSHPYRVLFTVITEILGQVDGIKSSNMEEHPDLHDLPYPLDYQ